MTMRTWTAGPRLAGGRTIEVSCHRQLGGPYTGVGAMLRQLVPEVVGRRPHCADPWAIEIVAIAPDLAGLLDPAPETLASVAVPEERTRIYPALRTRRIAHGVIDLLRFCAGPELLGSVTLSFTHVHEADPTDQEFLALLVRRRGHGSIRTIVQAEPEHLLAELTTALGEHARVDASSASAGADDLASGAGDWSAQLGSIPYQLERAGDTEQAVAALMNALKHCLDRGFYHAVIDYGMRIRAIVDPVPLTWDFWFATAKTATSHAVIGQPEQAEDLYLELRALSAEPQLQMNTSYALGMVYTRYFTGGRKDHRIAKAYVNNAIAMAMQIADPADQAFNAVFNRNGLALVEMHLGNLETALELVTEGLERLLRMLPPESHLLHKSVLIYNRASLFARLGRLDEALAAYNDVIAADPNWQDYYFERADIRRKLGDPAGALADYNHAESISPPFWELHYNRADLLAELGDTERAIADLARVVDLEPAELEPWHSLVALLQETGQSDRAIGYVAAGLAQHPGDAGLLCARGQLALDRADQDTALRDFGLALAADGDFVPALAARATLAFDVGDYAQAVADLSHALLVQGPDPDLLHNRAQAHQGSGDAAAAAADLAAAAELSNQVAASVP